jgi:AraC-like DNA-binding protein
MKPSLEKVASPSTIGSFLSYAFTTPRFRFKWHYHPEYELTLIVKGGGKRWVGDSYEPFASGDLVLMAGMLPHTWVSEDASRGKSNAVVIQFTEAYIQSFSQFSECDEIFSMLTKAKRGLVFSGKNLKLIKDKIVNLPHANGANRLIDLLSILHELSVLKSTTLSTILFRKEINAAQENRINRVCKYIDENFRGALPLKEVSMLINLSESAFCKFFKRLTGKTYSDYVNEVRIGHACRLLQESELAIAEIAYSVGFESLTYFNRVFVRKKKIKPREYRLKFSDR